MDRSVMTALPAVSSRSTLPLTELGGDSAGLLFDKLVMTVEDVAKELNCSVRTVQKLVSRDKIPYAKVGRLVRFSRGRLHDWLKQGGSR